MFAAETPGFRQQQQQQHQNHQNHARQQHQSPAPRPRPNSSQPGQKDRPEPELDRTQETSNLQPLRLKLDPGSKTTGLALVREVDSIDVATGEVHRSAAVVNLMDIVHRGSYQRTRLDKFGFPRGFLTRTKRVKGFGTGDLVQATVTKGLKIGQYVGRVAVRASGSFNIQTATGVVQGIGHKCCRVTQRADGYGYFLNLADKQDANGTANGNASTARGAIPPGPERPGFSRNT